MTTLKWWQRAVFYQIYPRSFADGNGDGIGDFPGIISRLDYLHRLGIEAIWLSPHYPSPFVDCGYDIADFSAVAPEYGTLADFKIFLEGAHARGIRVITDLVLNHTSDQHAWFQESRSGRDNPKRDWYIWRDGRDGGPPNNWASIFGGPAWDLDPQTGQYYYHAFLKEQPDLNWRNPEVKQAMWNMVRFWLDLGVDGFRLDAIGTIYEDPQLPDHNSSLGPDLYVDFNALAHEEYRKLMRYQIKQPGLHELMQELRAVVDEYPGDRVLIGEDEDLAFLGEGDNELHMVFNFPLLRTERLTPAHVCANQAERLAEMPPGGWPANTLGHHDIYRVWSHYGDGVHDAALARLHLALVLTLKGTPFLYNGEEIGMTDLELDRIEDFRDSAAINRYQIMTTQLGVSPADALRNVIATTRDRCRSPLQWRNAPHAGFCPPGATPWLPVNNNYRHGVNVADQEQDPDSMLNFYRRLIRLRQETPALLAGDYQELPVDNEAVLAFSRHDPASGQTGLVLLNFAATAQEVALEMDAMPLQVLFSSREREGERCLPAGLHLAPLEIFIATQPR